MSGFLNENVPSANDKGKGEAYTTPPRQIKRKSGQWYVAGYQADDEVNRIIKRAKPDNFPYVKPVPVQSAFTELDSVSAMRGRIQGLQEENKTVLAANKALRDEVLNSERHLKDAQRITRQALAREEDMKISRNKYLDKLAKERAISIQLEANWKAKETAIRTLQRQFNDAVNALLAQDVE